MRTPAMFKHVIASALLGWGAVSLAQAASLTYTFDTDVQGFSLVGDGLLAHATDAGNGHLVVTDTNGNTDVYLSVPLGTVGADWSAFLGGSLSFDAKMVNGITPSWPDFGTVRFTSTTDQVAQADLAPDVLGVITEPGVQWKTYSATLNAATFSGASLGGVLSSLKSVTISMEAGSGPVEVVGFDNFSVSSVPEPQSWVLSGLGLAGLAGLRLRRGAKP
jgi:PEP-CTERM motif